MRSHVIFISLLVLVVVALLLSSSCRTSSTESRAQLATDTSANQKTANTYASNSNSKNETEQRIRLLPIDEGSEDPSFQNFRNQLLVAVKNRDQGSVLRVLDPAINNGYDIEPGIREFRKRWRPEDSESSIWDVLLTILSGGGVFTERDGHRQFCGPCGLRLFSSFRTELTP